MDRIKGQINFNTVVSAIILGVVIWVGASIQMHTARLSELSQDVAVLKSNVEMQGRELNDVKAEQRANSILIAQIGFDVSGRPHMRPPPPVTSPPKQGNQ